MQAALTVAVYAPVQHVGLRPCGILNDVKVRRERIRIRGFTLPSDDASCVHASNDQFK